MADVKVTVVDETSSSTINLGGASLTPHKAVNNVSPRTNEVRQNKSSQKAIAIASMIGQQSFSYIAHNVGTMTGNTQTQTKIDNILQIASTASIALISPATAVASAGLQLGTTAITESIRKSRAEVELSQARARAGYSSGNVANYRRR